MYQSIYDIYGILTQHYFSVLFHTSYSAIADEWILIVYIRYYKMIVYIRCDSMIFYIRYDSMIFYIRYDSMIVYIRCDSMIAYIRCDSMIAYIRCDRMIVYEPKINSHSILFIFFFNRHVRVIHDSQSEVVINSGVSSIFENRIDNITNNIILILTFYI